MRQLSVQYKLYVGRKLVASTGGQGSHQLHAMALANALAITPPEVAMARGDAVPVLLLSL